MKTPRIWLVQCYGSAGHVIADVTAKPAHPSWLSPDVDYGDTPPRVGMAVSGTSSLDCPICRAVVSDDVQAVSA